MEEEEGEIVMMSPDSQPPSSFVDIAQGVLPGFVIKTLLEELKFEKPSPVQAMVIEEIKKGARQNLIVQSKNGTGKTLAFSTILLSNMKEMPISQIGIDEIKPLDVKGLIIAPTREIAIQIQEFLQLLTKHAPSDTLLSRTPALIIGGIDIKEQRRKLMVDQPGLIIGTPGRIKEIIDKEWLSLASINTVIIDEADKFCQIGPQNQSGIKFFEDMAFLVNKAFKSPYVQYGAFSATYTPDTLTKMKNLIPNSKFMVAHNEDNGQFPQQDSLDESPHLLNIRKFYQKIDAGQTFKDKIKIVADVLKQFFGSMSAQENVQKQAIVFFNYKLQGEEISRELKRLHGLQSVFIHGDQCQADRIKAFEKMRLMKLNLILASDLLSRGVDLPDVKLVINFDMPLTQAEFFHRIGRSGRFGASGTAMSLITTLELASYPYIQSLMSSMSSFSNIDQISSNIDAQQQKVIEQRMETQQTIAICRTQQTEKFEARQEAYKRLKIEQSDFSRLDRWVDTSHNLFQDDEFQYLEEEEDKEESNRLQQLADMMEIEYIPPSLPIDQGEVPEQKNCPAHFIDDTESGSFHQNVSKHLNDPESLIYQVSETLMFAHYCKYRDYYKSQFMNSTDHQQQHQ